MSKELKLLKELRKIYVDQMIASNGISKIEWYNNERKYMIHLLTQRINQIEDCQRYWTPAMLRELNTRRYN